MSERVTIHLDDLAKSIESTSHREQQYDRLVGSCMIANGCFDGLHPGHLSLFAYLDNLSYRERLQPLVAINSDDSVRRLKGSGRPVWSQDQRAKLINYLKWPFTVIIFDEDTPQRLMDILKPPMVLKGSEYAEESVVRWRDSVVVTVPMLGDWSTSKILGDTR